MLLALWILLVLECSKCLPALSASASEVAALRMLQLSEELRLSLEERENGGEGLGSALPFVTVSYAQTIDGSIAPLNRTRLDISSKMSFRLLHSLRATHAGVLVGINTVLCDQPRLNVRTPLPEVAVPATQPHSLIIDTDLRILEVAPDKLLLQRPIVFTCVDEDEDNEGTEKENIPMEIETLNGEGTVNTNKKFAREGRWSRAKSRLELVGGKLIRVAKDNSGHCDLGECLRICKSSLGIDSVLVEGGAGIIQTVLEQDLADQFIVTIRPAYFGGYRSMTSQLDFQHSLQNVGVELIEGDVIIRGTMR